MTWDKYFFDVCNAIAKNSKCLSRKVGAVLVKDNSIIATGYNRPPRGVPSCSLRGLYDSTLLKELSEFEEKNNIYFEDGCVGKNLPNMVKDYRDIKLNECPRKMLGYKTGEGLHLCVAGHGERNALVNAARHGVITKDAKLYCNCPVPCKDCLIEIINAGISEIIYSSCGSVVYNETTVNDPDEIYYDKMSEYLIKTSGIKIREYVF